MTMDRTRLITKARQALQDYHGDPDADDVTLIDAIDPLAELAGLTYLVNDEGAVTLAANESAEITPWPSLHDVPIAVLTVWDKVGVRWDRNQHSWESAGRSSCPNHYPKQCANGHTGLGPFTSTDRRRLAREQQGAGSTSSSAGQGGSASASGPLAGPTSDGVEATISTTGDTMSEDTPEICASIIRKYADLREEYLHGKTDFNGVATIDSERWLMCELQGLRKAADLISQPTSPHASMGLPSRHWAAWDGIVQDIRNPTDVARARKMRIIADVQEAVDARFEDGTSVLKYILLTNPRLMSGLRAALRGKRR